MKKFFILYLTAFIMCSCATTYSYLGNVTLLTDDGDTIEKWDNATLAQGDTYRGTYNTPYKNNGVEITTSQGETIYVNGGIIIVRNIEKIYAQGETESDSKEELITNYKNLYREIDELQNALKQHDKDSIEYQTIKSQIKSCKIKLRGVENRFWETYSANIIDYI
jgi:phage terminase large subunit